MPPLNLAVLYAFARRVALVVVVALACVLALAFAAFVGAWDAAWFGGSP